jgi:hypothetical protein
MSTRKTLAVWVLILGLTAASYALFAAVEAERGTVENASKDAAWQTKAEMEKVRP